MRLKLIIRKGNTKGKLATRTIPVIEDLRLILTNYQAAAGQDYLYLDLNCDPAFESEPEDSQTK